jgi:hypothetical protein
VRVSPITPGTEKSGAGIQTDRAIIPAPPRVAQD